MFFTLSSGSLFAQNPPEGGGFLADTIDGCMNNLPSAIPTEDLMARPEFDVCRENGDRFELHTIDPTGADGEWGVTTGFTKGSTDCSWTYYYVYSIKCGGDDGSGEVSPYTVQFNGGDGTRPKLKKGAVIPPGGKDLNLCYADIPAPHDVQYIADLFTDNCGYLKAGELVTMRTKSKQDDCKWIVIYTYTIWDHCTEPVEVSITYTGGDTESPEFVDSKNLPQDVTVDCDNIPDPVTLFWDDNCTPKGKVKSVDDVSNLGIGCEGGFIIRTWDIKDDCGNINSHTQKITVNPAPQVYFHGTQDVYIPCADKDDAASYIPVLGYTNGRDSDRCGINGEAKPNFEVIAESCGSFEVTYTFTDDCGFTINASLTAYIVDEINPSILTAADDMTVECDGQGNVEAYAEWLENNGGATAEDNCDTDLTWTNDDSSHPFSDDCGETGQKTIVFTVSDDCGNESKTAATFYIVDRIDPSVVPAEDLTVICDGEGNTNQYQVWLDNNGGATASDECSKVTWTHDGPVLKKGETLKHYLEGGCSNWTGYVQVTFTATDECGNYTNTTATFTIEDSFAPIISTEASNMTVECDGSMGDDPYGTNNAAAYQNWLNNHGGAIADPDACSEISWKYEAYKYGDACDTYYYVTFTVSDECGNSSSTSAEFHVVDTNSPALTEEAHDMVVECKGGFDHNIDEASATGDSNMYQFYQWLRNNGGASAIDLCDDYLDWTNDYDGKSFTDDCGFTGRITVLFTVWDDCGLSSTTAAEFVIVDTTAPTFTAPYDTTIYKDETCKFESDPYYTGDVYDEWDNCSVYDLQATYSDKISDYDCPGSSLITRTWSLVDECGNKADDQVQYIYVIDNSAPVLTGTIPPNMSNLDLCEAPVGPSEADVAAAFTDNCSNVVVTKTTNTVQVGECGWATQFTYEVSDECGNYLDPIKILYWGSDQSAPELAPGSVLPKDNHSFTSCAEEALNGDGAGATEDEVFKLFTDNCDKYVDVYKSGYYFTKEGCDWAYYFEFTITDNCDNSYSFKQYFSGSDKTAPVLVGEVPEDVSDINECKYEALQYTAAGPSEYDIAQLFSECSGYYGSVNVTKATHTFGDDCNWIISHEYTIYDDCGNFATPIKITYSGGDIDAPEFIQQCAFEPLYLTTSYGADCPADAYASLKVGDEITAYDTWYVAGQEIPSLYNCVYDDCTSMDDLIIRVTEVTNSKDSCNNTITITFEAEDSCGNVSTVPFTCVYVVIDDTPPTATAPADVVVECQADVPAANVKDITDEADNCNTTTVTHEGDVTDGEFPIELITRTYRVTDACGNYTEVTQTIKVEDTTAPEITCSGDIEVNGTDNGAVVNYDAPIHSDNCDPNPVLTLESGFDSGETFPVGDTTVEYKSTDASGNFAVCSFVVTVVNTTPTQSVDSGDLSMELNFTAYPVPFNKDVNIKYNFKFDTDVTIQVFDTKGLLVLSRVINGYKAGSDFTLPLSINGADQLYYVRLTTDRGTVTKKIVSSNVNKQ